MSLQQIYHIDGKIDFVRRDCLDDKGMVANLEGLCDELVRLHMVSLHLSCCGNKITSWISETLTTLPKQDRSSISKMAVALKGHPHGALLMNKYPMFEGELVAFTESKPGAISGSEDQESR
eukprot:m.128656 g.128656  ORF g.128656 m.128656 type:complete len:121 (-) comp9453_c0_seq4:2888-3250(-)